MNKKLKTLMQTVFLLFTGFLLGVFLLYLHHTTNRQDLDVWHTEELPAEVTSEDIQRMSGLQEYIEREQLLFGQLEEKVYKKRSQRPAVSVDRYLSGSWSDPSSREQNWNKTILLTRANPRANVLMLHRLSDSPYSFQAPQQPFLRHCRAADRAQNRQRLNVPLARKWRVCSITSSFSMMKLWL